MANGCPYRQNWKLYLVKNYKHECGWNKGKQLPVPYFAIPSRCTTFVLIHLIYLAELTLWFCSPLATIHYLYFPINVTLAFGAFSLLRSPSLELRCDSFKTASLLSGRLHIRIYCRLFFCQMQTIDCAK